MMKLSELLDGVEILETLNLKEDIPISGITDNSKEVKPGYLFVARGGTKTHGERFIPEAVERGAVAILRESEPDSSLSITQIRVKELPKATARLVLRFYGHPEKKLSLVGITGTNGKSSVSYFLKNLLERLGLKAGYVGTLFYDIGERLPAEETTPSIFKLGPLLRRAVANDLKYVVMEVSSHALDQDRIKGLTFELASFTNLSRDHLDYHQDMEAYYNSKKKLFTDYLQEEGKGVISLESPWGKRLYEELLGEGLLPKERLLTVNDGEVRVEILERKPGLKLGLTVLGNRFEVETSLIGDYQAKNVGTLLGIALALGFKPQEVILALKGLKNPPGRLELCGEKDGAYIFVDYAHTPDALENAIKSLLPLRKGRLLVLFGCGGNRDPGKRPLMGRVAQGLSDLLLLTSDNPRDEDPLKIIEDIKRGLNGSKPFYCIPERREALYAAIKELRAGDILLVAGKGHETYQEIRGKRYPFSDKAVIKEILEELGYGDACCHSL